MNEFVSINLDGTTPLLATAIHDGHLISEDLVSLFALKESAQLREEDPFTALWTDITGNSIIARHSRFEFDLNRPPEKAVYILPSDAWGLEVWRTKPSASVIARSQQRYTEIYHNFHEAITELVSRYNGLVVFDLHSYNHRRNGPNAPPEDETMNPEINLGTGTMDRTYWGSLVDRFMMELQEYDFFDRHLDVRENIKFKGGHFSRWIHENFKESVCCLSIEAKKFFMDEWTGEPDHSIINAIGEALKATVPGVMEELLKRRASSHTDQ